MYSFHRSLKCHTNCHIPEVVPLQLEHLDLVEPVEGEAGDLDQPVLVQLENPQAFQVDEHLTVVIDENQEAILYGQGLEEN